MLFHHSFPVPHGHCSRSLYLLLQLEYPIQQGLSCGRATRNININRNNLVTPSHHSIGIMVISTTISTTIGREREGEGGRGREGDGGRETEGEGGRRRERKEY